MGKYSSSSIQYGGSIVNRPSNSLLMGLCAQDSAYSKSGVGGSAAVSSRDYKCMICKKHVKANEYHIHEKPRPQGNGNNRGMGKRRYCQH
jgi:hypothetical protein